MPSEPASGIEVKQLTTSAGTQVPDNQIQMTAGARGPLLIQSHQLIPTLAHQNRQRIPDRAVHARGWGPHGTLTATHDITQYAKAKVFSKVSKKRP